MSFTAQYSMFEGLFDRVLKPAGPFREELLAAGYDSASPIPVYPMQVWHDCLKVSARFLFPQQPLDQALRAIGRQFLAGYFETIIGRMIAAAFPYFSPRTLMLRAPRLLRSGIKEMQTEIEWLSETKVKLTMRGPHEGAGFFSAASSKSALSGSRRR